jgi:glycine/D-amino acid oxidase-like deaminating enzyme
MAACGRTILLTAAIIRASLAFISPFPIGISTVMSAASGSNSDNDSQGRNIVIVGGGIQGTSCAFHLHQSSYLRPGSSITILESQELASAASGKGGGFMARSWGDGTDTQTLHELAFDMYESLSSELNLESYRKLPVISVSPGSKNNGKQDNKKTYPELSKIIPNWLDGSVGRLTAMGWGEDTAQVTPKEFVHKMIEYVNQGEGPGVKIVIGTCVGIESVEDADGVKVVTGVKYHNGQGETILPADDVIVAAGPWACQAEKWFDNAVKLPMEGIKSTSIVWKPPLDDDGNVNLDAVEATALFCGEDSRFGTHLEVYPRPDGTVYICGIGGSDYITTSELQASAFMEECPPKSDRVKAASSAFQLMSNSYATKGELSHAQACKCAICCSARLSSFLVLTLSIPHIFH